MDLEPRTIRLQRKLTISTSRAFLDNVGGSSMGRHALAMTPYEPFIEGHTTDMRMIGWSTNMLKRATRSSSSAILQEACNAHDEGVCSTTSLERAHRMHGDEAPRDRRRERHNLNRCHGRATQQQLDRTELLGLKDKIAEHDTYLKWCHSDTQLADSKTTKK